MNLKRTVGTIKLGLRKVGPDIALGAGVICGIVAVVEFCRKTRHAIPIVDEYKETFAELKESHDITHDDNAFRKDVLSETAKTGLKLAKVYAKPVILYSVSTGLVIKSHTTLRNRNAALVAAYAGIGGELRNLKKKIAERYGEDALDELTHGIKKVEVEETRVDEETGKEVTEKKIVSVVDGDVNNYSPYARFFDEGSNAWKNDAEYNLVYLMERENEANQRLRTQGYLLLNDVYDMLDIPRTKAGCEVGWRYYAHGENPCGDNYITFGIHNIRNSAVRDFVNGYEKNILLDFNVDGGILDVFPRI